MGWWVWSGRRGKRPETGTHLGRTGRLGDRHAARGRGLGCAWQGTLEVFEQEGPVLELLTGLFQMVPTSLLFLRPHPCHPLLALPFRGAGLAPPVGLHP